MNRFGPEWISLYAALWAVHGPKLHPSEVATLADKALFGLLDYRILERRQIWKQNTSHLRIGRVKGIKVGEPTLVTLDNLDYRTLKVCPQPFEVSVNTLLAGWEPVPYDIVEFRLDRNTGNMRGFRKDEPLQKHMSR